MTTDHREHLRTQLIQHEGLKLRLYRCTAGRWSIGVGRNLQDRGISAATAMQMLEEDIDIVVRELAGALPWFSDLDPVRQMALVDMGFNLGVPKLLRFTRMLAAIARHDWDLAEAEALDSKWCTDIGPSRSGAVASMLRTGTAPER